MKRNYYVSFIYTVMVEADSTKDAEDKAHEAFEKMLYDPTSDGLRAGDFVMSDPEEVEYEWE